MALAQQPGLMPLGGYWKLPQEDRIAFRRKLRDLWALPSNRVPSEKQMLLIASTYKRSMKTPIFFGGAMGGGKSDGLCMLAIHLARAIPKNRVLMCRKEFSAFSGSTLQLLEEQLEACPDARHWPGKHEVHFPNGAEIWYMGVGTPQQRAKLGSYQFGAVLIDEGPEVEREIYQMLQTRMRHGPAARAKRLVLALTGNPFPGWIKSDFISPASRRPGYTFIPSTAFDNEFLDPNYIPDMKSEMPEEWYKAFILGDWDALVPYTAIISYKLMQEARTKRREPKDISNPVWGLDCGHVGGDRSVLSVRYGYHFDIVDHWSHATIDQSVDAVLRNYTTATYKPTRLVVDYDGIGAGVADYLKRYQTEGDLPQTLEIVGLNAQKRASIEQPFTHTPMRYDSMKAQNAFEFRRMLEGNHGDFSSIDANLYELIEQDMTTPNYEVIDGRIYIETKKLVRKKLGRSPDFGDSLWLTMYAGSADEFAGLPTNADRLIPQLEMQEEQELVMLENHRRKVNWYRNPFGIRKAGPADYSEDLGY